MNPSTSFSVTPQSGSPTLATAQGRSETVEELRRRNELILNAVGEGLYGLDLEGRVTFVNPAGCELLGWAAEELIGRKMHEVLHHSRADGTHFPAEECPIYQTWKDGAIHRSQDDTFWHKDGRAIPVEYVSTPLLEGDRIVGAVVAFSDITSRKRRELELMTLRDELATQVSDMARLQQVSFRLLGHGDYTSLMQDVIESAMALMQADRGNLRLYDAERGSLEIVAQKGFDSESLDGLKAVPEDVGSGGVVHHGTPVMVEDVQTDPIFEGRRKLAAAAGYRAVCSFPLLDRQGQVLGVLSVYFNRPHRLSEWKKIVMGLHARQASELIERRYAEDVLRQQAELLKLAHDAVIVRHMNGLIRLWNTGAVSLYGWEQHEAVGQYAHELLQTQFPIPRQEIETALLRDGRWDGELIHKAKDGSMVTVLSRWSLQRKDDGGLLLLEINRDITERKLAEEQLNRLYQEATQRQNLLREKQEQLVQAGKLATLGEMATGIAHELNNPLNNIGLFLGNVIDHIELGQVDPDRIVKSLHDSLEQMRKASEIISHLRVFGRGEPVARRPCLIHQIIHEALSLLRQQFRLRQIDLDMDLCSGNPTVLGNPTQLEQVFLNLLTNARDALEAVTEKKIWVRTVQVSDHVEIHISDTGAGIPAGLENRIFDPFFTTKEVGHGTGLGLSISYSIIKAHEGTISVLSPPGSGAEFVIRLPMGQEATLPQAPLL